MITIPEQIGHFEVKNKLGYGGMGTVYLARDPRLNRSVAIKVMHEHLGLQDQFRDRFAREAQAIAALDHPHIIRIFYADAERGRPYLVMEYFQDGSLREHLNTLLEQGKVLSVQEVIHLIKQVAAALDYAHRKNMVHRDVKPDNVLLKSSLDLESSGGPFSAVLSDFGLVKMVEGTEMESQAVPQGTYPYMAPEQFTSRPKDYRIDIYSLGMMFYELLTGHLPFRSKSIMEIARMHIEEEPPPFSKYRSDIPPPLENVVMQCIAKWPDERFSTGKELINALMELESDRKFGTTLENMDTVIDRAGRLGSLTSYLEAPTAIEPSSVPFNLGAGLSANISVPVNHLRLEAGQEGELKVVVHNHTSSNEIFRLMVTDIPPEWVRVTEQQIRLAAGKSADFTIQLHPPRRSWANAGHHRINFKIFNHQNQQIAEASSLITIATFHDLQADLDPKLLRPPRGEDVGKVAVMLHNRGNSTRELTITLHDDDGELMFTPSSMKLTLKPGEREKVPFRVGLRSSANDMKERFSYSVSIRPLEGETTTRKGHLLINRTQSGRNMKILTIDEVRRLSLLAEVMWGFVAVIVFGWLFLILDMVLTSEQLLDRPNSVNQSWAMLLPEDNIVTILILVLAIGLGGAVVGYLKQRLNVQQNKRMTFWVDTGFAALLPVAFIGVFFLAIEIFGSGLKWSAGEGRGVTPAAIIVSATLTLGLMIAAKNVVVNRVLR